jgi:5-methyltetrahydropteroyltriglutamate--homocysteine methyltransferase
VTELGFARALIAEVVAGLPPSRLALHVCRGTLFLELCTPRAGEIDVLKDLPASGRIGVVNQKLDRVESPEEIVAQARRAVEIFGADRVLLTPDCGFATFADSPVTPARVAEDKLRAIARGAAILAGRAPGQQAARWQ